MNNHDTNPMRVAYLVSRFPHVTETFIVRELEAVDRDPEIEIELLSLFPTVDPTVHPIARRWTERLRRPSTRESALAVGWWLLRRPLRFAGAVATVVFESLRKPGILGRSLVTVPIAAAHARRLHADPVDHIHAHYATYPALAAWICHRLTGVSYSFTVHAHDIFVHQEMLARKVADASFVVAISEYNRRFLAPYGGGSATPVEIVHCGIDPAAFQFRPRLAPATGPVRAACVASLQEYKGHEVLLRALADGGGDLARIELDLVGDGVLRPSLEQLARDLGISERVRFHGSLTEPEVRAVLAEADIFVLPSIVARDGQMEGLPVALMEALASGLFAVSTRLSGIPELVRDGETGALAEPGDAASLAGALERAVQDASEARARAGRELVEREFDIAASGTRMAELLKDSVRQPSN
jgi:colanic acid/amylovoran biosynthesis glycosyltransferase